VVIPGAQVTITNNVTGVSRPPIATDSTGFYVADDLPQGTYTVTVEAKGFKKTSVTGNTLMTGSRKNVNVTMGVDAAMEPDDWQSGLQLYSAATGWGVPGEYTFEVFQVGDSSGGSRLRPARSNVVDIQIADPSTIARKWGPKVKGLAVDVTLDKNTFRVGEDVPLHMAIENFDAEVPVSSYVPDVPSLFEIEVRDAKGQPISDRFPDPFNYTGRYETQRYPKGEVVPLERTLWREGWLPNRPGTYTIVVTWAAWDDSKNDSKSSGATRLGPAPYGTTQAPYATAQATATIHILDADNSASK
jgi:Carboxypeptidase regulatory-like domain